jgi:hypothetical protein
VKFAILSSEYLTKRNIEVDEMKRAASNTSQEKAKAKTDSKNLKRTIQIIFYSAYGFW